MIYRNIVLLIIVLPLQYIRVKNRLVFSPFRYDYHKITAAAGRAGGYKYSPVMARIRTLISSMSVKNLETQCLARYFQGGPANGGTGEP
jgi:hypothetical protein